MAHPFHHAVSSAKQWGGSPDDYLLLHQWMDQSKAADAGFRHRALLHHSFGIFMLEQHFGPVIEISTGRAVPVRFIAEQHVITTVRLSIEQIQLVIWRRIVVVVVNVLKGAEKLDFLERVDG